MRIGMFAMRVALGGMVMVCPTEAALRADGTATPAESGKTLGIVTEYRIPVTELSGLAPMLRGGPIGLYAIGDSSFDVARVRIDPETGAADMGVLALGGVSPAHSQWEAIAADGETSVCMLAETTDQLTCFSRDFQRVVGRLTLDPAGVEGLDEVWLQDPNSRGEGIVLLKRGHVLVLKEKNPSMLVEFGPEGEESLGFGPETLLSADEGFAVAETGRLVAIKVWRFSKKLAELAKDASDLAVGPDRRLYMLSDQSTELIRLESRLNPNEGKVSPSAWWQLPNAIDKPEGLVIDTQMRPWVASDIARAGGPNLFLLGPIASR